MSQPPPLPRPEVSRPYLIDHLAVLAGVALSLYLMHLAPLKAEPSAELDWRLRQAYAFLALIIRLPEGVLLLWPVFFGLQYFRRSERLSAGEWLWLLGWVGAALLTVLALVASLKLEFLPESLPSLAEKARILYYLLVTPALALLALLVALLGLFRSWVPPWTHSLALALLLWPAPAAALVLLTGGLTSGESRWLE